MKKGIRNNIILWSTISLVILLLFALPILRMITPDRDEQNRVARLKDNTIHPTEIPPIAIKLTETKTETPQKPTAKATNNLSHKSIVYSARYAIREYLKSPSSASFPAWPDNSYGVTTLENNTYLVSGKVTAKNAYGVKLQNTWIIKLEFSGSNLEIVRAIYVKIDNKVLLDVP